MVVYKAPARRRYRNYRSGGYLGLELKFLDCAWNGVTVNNSSSGASGEMPPSSGCTGCISAPAQGDGESQRDGRNFVIKSVFASGIIATTGVQNSADVIDTSGYYVALVLDTQTNGATIVSEDVFINPSTQNGAMIPQPLRNLENVKRFRILASKYIKPGGAYASTDGTNTASVQQQETPTFTLSWSGNIKVNTNGTTANVSSVTDNSIHLIAYNGGDNMAPTLIGKSRVRFMG